MMTIEQFCKKYGACEPGQTWALANCKTMQEAWDTAPEPRWVAWIAIQPGVLTDRELRLFACFCARQNWHLLTDPRSRNAVEVAERYAEGNASQEELEAAAWAAWSAAWMESLQAAAWAAWSAARAESQREAAAWAAEADGTVATQQAEWLRKNTKPNFD